MPSPMKQLSPAHSRIGWIGTGVMGGMFAATFLAIFFVPVFFVLLRKLSRRKAQPETNVTQPTIPNLPLKDQS